MSQSRPEEDFPFVEDQRRPGETNLDWLQRVIPAIPKLEKVEVADPTFVLLFGGRSAYDFRIRVSQSHLRHDVSPSHWSHTAIIRKTDVDHLERLRGAVVLETSLEPSDGFRIPSTYNGLQTRYLRYYDAPQAFPSIAVMRVPVDQKIWNTDSSHSSVSLLEQFAMRRSLLDVPVLIIKWLEYVWSVGVASNPLLNNWGVPSAAVVDTLLSAAGYEMCPGLDSQATSPEAFWQAARWWHPYYEVEAQPRIAGFFSYERDVYYDPRPDAQPSSPALDLEKNSRATTARKTTKKATTSAERAQESTRKRQQEWLARTRQRRR